MQVRPVVERSDLKAFIQFPYDHYKDDPVWVPLLRFEQRKLFNPRKNPFLDHCDLVSMSCQPGGGGKAANARTYHQS